MAVCAYSMSILVHTSALGSTCTCTRSCAYAVAASEAFPRGKSVRQSVCGDTNVASPHTCSRSHLVHGLPALTLVCCVASPHTCPCGRLVYRCLHPSSELSSAMLPL